MHIFFRARDIRTIKFSANLSIISACYSIKNVLSIVIFNFLFVCHTQTSLKDIFDKYLNLKKI